MLGVSEQCIATYAGDLANALAAVDATVRIAGVHGERVLPVTTLHRLPGATPEIETDLAPGEVITAV